MVKKDVLPLLHIIKQNRRMRNDSVDLMKDVIFSHLSPFSLTIFWAIGLWNIEHSLPIPPEIENTNCSEIENTKVPCSGVFFLYLSRILVVDR